MAILFQLLYWICIVVGIGLTVVVALQTSKSEGLSGILAGGGGGGGKVGKERGLESVSKYLAYSWLAMAGLLAFLRQYL